MDGDRPRVYGTDPPHHSSSGSGGPFAAEATYDVLSNVPADAGEAGGDSGVFIAIGEPQWLSFDSNANSF
ncbi:MAG: hypothetical protein ABSC94_01410 [Polyangiaceae bacterium]